MKVKYFPTLNSVFVEEKDYSNIMFEFLLSERPCFIYATDIEEYRKQRDYYFDIYDLPFPVATNSDELVKAMTEFEQEKYKKRTILGEALT